MPNRLIILVLCLCLLLVPGPAMAAPGPAVPGFRIAPVVEGVHHPTRLVFGPDGRLYIAQQTGEVIAVTLRDGAETGRQQVAKASHDLLGIALKDDTLYVSDTGRVLAYTRQPDGSYGDPRAVLPEVPNGLHQNDGLLFGPDGMLYLGIGSTTDRGPEKHPWSGTILRFDPARPESAEPWAKGFRNPFGMAWDDKGQLWVTDNGADDPATSDELNLVVQGGDYGFPRYFERPPANSGTTGPVALFGLHNSTNGLAFAGGSVFPAPYRDGFFVAMWGSSFDEITGRRVAFVTRDGQITDVATGFERPLDVTIGPDGDLFVADFVAGIIYRMWWEGTPPGGPGSAPSPGPMPGPGPGPTPEPTTGPSPNPVPLPPPGHAEPPTSGSAAAWLLLATGAVVVLIVVWGWQRKRGRSQ
ncbi:MAG TPA: PQQ-dependent sugar dehydrogenase [Symbiobacteriaceae bacterium]|nr:PQQ-dependent sugar dehydrogenase [Symbiobacteriaceae bacterium]